MNRSQRLEEVMAEIQELMLQYMKDDLEDPEKRTPQLYNAIIKELQRNGIDCLPKAGEDQGNALQRLLESTKAHFESDYGDPLQAN